MKLKSFVRTVSAALWAILLSFYVAAMIDFFTRYEPFAAGNYVREHSVI